MEQIKDAHILALFGDSITTDHISPAGAIPVDGPNWQAMRLSRNRRWGHPDLIKIIEQKAWQVSAVMHTTQLIVTFTETC